MSTAAIVKVPAVIELVTRLDENDRLFAENRRKSVEHGTVRDDLLAEGLRLLAVAGGITLKEPLHNNALGEYSVVAVDAKALNPNSDRCGPFGAVFAGFISKVPWRTGARLHTRAMEHSNGWCHVNHFSVERLLREVAEESKD